MDKIQALQVIRGVIDRLRLLSQDNKIKYSGEDTVEEAYAIIHKTVENDIKEDFHLSDYLMDAILKESLVTYTVYKTINGYDVKLAISKQDEDEKEDAK